MASAAIFASGVVTGVLLAVIGTGWYAVALYRRVN